MKTHPQDTELVSLLKKYLENRCTEQELFVLLNWLKMPSHAEAFNLGSDRLWEQIDRETSYPDENRREELNQEVDLLLQKIRERAAETTKNKPLFRRNWFIRSAAVILLLLSLGTGYYLWDNAQKQPESYVEVYYTQRGETKKLVLSDGTRIVLNSESKLVVPPDYNQKERAIEMTGEGFFEVTPDAKRPFTIQNGDACIKVIGTSFNAKAYEEDEYLNVTVSSGQVLVNIPKQDLQLRVTPLEHLSIHKRTGNLTKLPLKENYYANWMTGILFFDKEPLTEVIKTINRKYDKYIVLKCNDCQHIISGTHDNKSIEAIVDAICFTTRLAYKTEGDVIILYD